MIVYYIAVFTLDILTTALMHIEQYFCRQASGSELFHVNFKMSHVNELMQISQVWHTVIKISYMFLKLAHWLFTKNFVSNNFYCLMHFVNWDILFLYLNFPTIQCKIFILMFLDYFFIFCNKCDFVLATSIYHWLIIK